MKEMAAGLIVGLVLFFVLIPLIVLGENNKRTNTFNYGYCYAMGGEIVSDDICVKNSVVIPIPERP